MLTKQVYWRNAGRKRFRLVHERSEMFLLRWQAKRVKLRKSIIFLVRQGEGRYVVVVDA